MNDEEINEIIARNEDEVHIFRELDIKRERDALAADGSMFANTAVHRR